MIRFAPKFTLALTLLMSSLVLANDARNGQWQQDIEFIRTNIETLHVDPFARVTSSDFNSALDSIISKIPNLSDEQLVLEISKSIALLKDAHSFVFLLHPLIETFMQQDQTFASLPFRLRWLKDGIFVTETNRDNGTILGGELISINGVSAQQLALEAAAYFPVENDVARQHWGMRAITIPAILERVTGKSVFEFQLKLNGSKKIFTWSATDVVSWPQAPYGINVDPNWVRLNQKKNNPPLYLQGPEQLFRAKTLKDIFYIQIKQMSEHEGINAKDYLCAKLEEAKELEQAHLVLDLRFNDGGETDYLNDMVRCLGASKFNTPDNLHVIIGEKTFSASQLLSVWLRQFTHARFYGEPTAMQTHFYANPRPSMKLPNSGLTILLSTVIWQPTHMERNQVSFRPDVDVRYSSQDLLQGTDPILESVLGQIKAQ